MGRPSSLLGRHRLRRGHFGPEVKPNELPSVAASGMRSVRQCGDTLTRRRPLVPAEDIGPTGIGAAGGRCARPRLRGLLPTTDAVIVLTQLAKDSGADRSVSEISVLPQHFIMDEFIDWPIVSRNRAHASPVVKTRCKNLVGEPLTSLPPLTRLRRAPSSVVSFSLAVLRVGRRHCSAGTVSAENISARRSNPTSSRQSRQSGMPSVRQCGDTLTRRCRSRQRHREDRIRRSTRAMYRPRLRGVVGDDCRLRRHVSKPRSPVRPLCFSLAAVFRARAFQILIDGRFAVLSGKRGFHVHGLPSAFDAP